MHKVEGRTFSLRWERFKSVCRLKALEKEKLIIGQVRFERMQKGF